MTCVSPKTHLARAYMCIVYVLVVPVDPGPGPDGGWAVSAWRLVRWSIAAS